MKPTWERDGVQLYLGDCLSVLPSLSGVDAVVTDPPYGCHKAEWDQQWSDKWYRLAKRLGCPIYTITGSAGVKDAVAMVGEDFVDIIAARNMNGMTRGPIGFGNWLSAVVSNGKPYQGPNCFDFVIRDEMPRHPSPKPIEYMLKLIERVTLAGKTVADPFMGSGSTIIACIRTGRRAIGIEIDPVHFATARDRIEREMDSQPLIAELEAKERQLEFVA